MPFDRLESDRLTLRRFTLADAPALAAYRSHPEVARYQSWRAPYSPMQAHALVQSMQGREPGGEGWFQFALEERLSGQLLGDLGLFAFEEHQAEIGYTLARPAWGRGLGAEAVGTLLNFVFGQLTLHRVVARTDPRNENSARLLWRLGFRREGRLLESYWDGEAWQNDDLYALLAREWLGRDPT